GLEPATSGVTGRRSRVFREKNFPLGVDTPEHHFLVTDAEERFRRIAGEFLEQEIANLELVTL
ncbi:MAG TPA: hypothetical protein VF111_03540, partial [Thermoanaerobaculia bacterium]